MPMLEEGQHWIIESVGIIFIIVGASKLLYDIVLWNNFIHWKVYMAIMLIGGVASGYRRIEKIVGKTSIGRV